MDSYGDFIAENRSAFENCIIILGGGSFGNIIPHKYGLNGTIDCQGSAFAGLHPMTQGMRELASGVCERWAAKGVVGYPLTCSSFLFRNGEGVPKLLNAQIFRLLLRNGVIPVVTGDLIFREQPGPRRYEIFSSDYLPSVLADHMKISKAIMLTDVDGIFSPDTGAIFSEVTKRNVRAVIDSATGSRMQDFTGGMKTKLASLLELSGKGVASLVCNGNKMDDVATVVLTKDCPGTRIDANITVPRDCPSQTRQPLLDS